MRVIVGIATHRSDATLSPSLQSPAFIKALAAYESALIIISQEYPICVPDRLRQEVGQVLHRHNNFNRGCGGVRQQVVDIALTLIPANRGGAALVFLDDDIHITGKCWLDNLLEPLKASKADIAGIETMKVTSDGYTISTDTPEYVSGGWAAIRLSVFECCQFDPQFFPNYWEDVDLGYQARNLGFKIAGVPCEGLVHKHEGAPGDAAFLANRERWLKKWRA